MAAKLVLRVIDVVLAVLARLLFLLFAYSCGWSLLTKAELDAARWSADDSRPPIEDASALFLHDLDDLRIALDRFDKGNTANLAEQATGRHVLFGRHVLTAQEHDVMFQERAVKLFRLAVVERLRQIQPFDFRADVGGQRTNDDGLIGRHGQAPPRPGGGPGRPP